MSAAILLSAALDIFVWIYTLAGAPKKRDVVFLHYTIHYGVDYIGKWTAFFIIPLLGLCIWSVNIAVAYWLYGRTKELARLLAASTAVMEFFLALALAALFTINS